MLLALVVHADAGGDLDREIDFAERVRVLVIRLGDRISEGMALHRLAAVAHHKGNGPGAADLARTARALFRRSGHRPGLDEVDELLTSLGQTPAEAAVPVPVPPV